MGGHPKIGVKPPKWMVKIKEKPMTKWMIWRYHHFLGKTHINIIQPHGFAGMIVSFSKKLHDAKQRKVRLKGGFHIMIFHLKWPPTPQKQPTIEVYNDLHDGNILRRLDLVPWNSKKIVHFFCTTLLCCEEKHHLQMVSGGNKCGEINIFNPLY